MKKLGIFFMLIAFAIAYTPQTFAQTADNKVTVDKSDLTATQLAKIEADKIIEKKNAEIAELQRKAETYGKWVGVGGEVGAAVKEGLTAVVDVADKFGKTDVGKFTLVMVAWKVMGKDVVKIFLGLFFFIVLSLVIIKVYRRVVIGRKIMVENPGFFKYPKKYDVIKADLSGDNVVVMTLILLCVYLIGIWITYSIMF